MTVPLECHTRSARTTPHNFAAFALLYGGRGPSNEFDQEEATKSLLFLHSY